MTVILQYHQPVTSNLIVLLKIKQYSLNLDPGQVHTLYWSLSLMTIVFVSRSPHLFFLVTYLEEPGYWPWRVAPGWISLNASTWCPSLHSPFSYIFDLDQSPYYVLFLCLFCQSISSVVVANPSRGTPIWLSLLL